MNNKTTWLRVDGRLTLIGLGEGHGFDSGLDHVPFSVKFASSGFYLASSHSPKTWMFKLEGDSKIVPGSVNGV